LDYERDTQRVLCDGEVFKEGVQAFLEKRKPNFRDIEEV
jgi:1,4-dihydroxy-2-naphthoyl-CoA synthase